MNGKKRIADAGSGDPAYNVSTSPGVGHVTSRGASPTGWTAVVHVAIILLLKLSWQNE
jgi:hypothetical protein